MCTTVQLLAEIMVAPFTISSTHVYPPPQADGPLSFFPNLPQLHGDAVYIPDLANQASTDSDSCRKNAYGHPTLSPGVFTIFCEHGVCYGFEILKSHESPRHPFSIFKTRFCTPPRMIIYDNCCKLHAYCLNREPVFFKNTLFLVDRFHWRGHVGCSKGYSLDSYKRRDTKQINSQVNEQANAGLKRMQSQLTYMKPENFSFHISLFLAVKNKDKVAKLDISRIHM